MLWTQRISSSAVCDVLVDHNSIDKFRHIDAPSFRLHLIVRGIATRRLKCEPGMAYLITWYARRYSIRRHDGLSSGPSMISEECALRDSRERRSDVPEYTTIRLRIRSLAALPISCTAMLSRGAENLARYANTTFSPIFGVQRQLVFNICTLCAVSHWIGKDYRQTAEDGIPVAIIFVIRIRESGKLRLGGAHVEGHQLVLALDTEGSEGHCVDQRENGGVGADAESQGHNRGGGKAGTGAEPADCEGQVVAQHGGCMGTSVTARKLRILNQIVASSARFWDDITRARSLRDS